MATQDDDSPTPTTLPGRPRRLPTPNGVPIAVEFENTGEIVRAMSGMNLSPEAIIEAFAGKLLEKSNASGGGGDAGDKTLKEIKKHKWLAGLMSLVLGSGGMVGSYYALKARAESNTEQVESLNAATKATQADVGNNENEIRLIKVDVSGIRTSVDGMKIQQTAIADGIDSLKQENVDRLEKENEKLERELSRMRRDDR